jgi:hypothetical protein
MFHRKQLLTFRAFGTTRTIHKKTRQTQQSRRAIFVQNLSRIISRVDHLSKKYAFKNLLNQILKRLIKRKVSHVFAMDVYGFYPIGKLFFV